MNNLPDSVRDCDLPGSRPEDIAGELYQDWLDANIEELLEDYCFHHQGKFLEKWKDELRDFAVSMSTGLADFDAFCRKRYEEGE